MNKATNKKRSVPLAKSSGVNIPLIGTVTAGQPIFAYENYEDSITFIQYQAGAMGLNLQKANKMIYFSLPERSDLFEQSKKRTHRMGQDRPCFYWIMQCADSVEELILQTLNERKDFTDELFKEIMGHHHNTLCGGGSVD